MKKLLAFLPILLFLFSCKNPSSDKAPEEQTALTDTVKQIDNSSKTELIYRIADSLINNHGENIWNLSDVDTTDFFDSKDYFTDKHYKTELILLSGEAGSSSGTARNLLLLFSDNFKLLWEGQEGEFSASDIQDLNNDGIKEIVIRSATVWMGECHDIYDIINFKGGKKRNLFSAHSQSIVDCGGDFLPNYKAGDTVETKYDCKLNKMQDGTFSVYQIKAVKLHNGGTTEDDIMKKLVTYTDTAEIKIQ
ncbi:hypothetical protein F0919_17490 [Taibaiella lutea]|uniref:VCBS repeat-containing protein n=1 Tax=Taibaiella lutea TaxID=2608001 RepID=A0A5M6CBS3_9BACT|nr:hypothetical protein [Taibaiella lutea]KAA5532576.1 hypothetical protein F0919_17490 [Taibaiella lutea]